MSVEREIVFITSPLEDAHVARIQAEAPEQVTVVHESDLHPATRYIADHKGVDGHVRTQEQEQRWRDNLSRATILWDFPQGEKGRGGGLDHAPNVKWVQTTSSGVGQLVGKFALADHPVIITTARGIHAVPLAEFVMMALLMHTKRLLHLQSEQRLHRWERHCGTDLRGRVMAIVGAGKVGAEVARLARSFGMRILSVVNKPHPERATELYADQVFGSDQLGCAIEQADCVTLCVPHTPDTENMIDADMIGRMKKGVVFVNVARGAVVDEKALIQALENENVAFAALDVARVEPLQTDSPLWDMPNVLISPHSASTVESENERIADIFIENLKRYTSGRRGDMINVLDKQKMY